jgi:branched-chain amino acid transport system permease protein
MLQYVIAGLVLGGIYAIASAGLVITYVSSGILNFSFGALAYFVARFYYYLHTQQNWGIPYAAIVAILIAGPALGVFLYFMLFRFLRLSSPLVKVVATLGLLVAIPALSTLIFGNEAISSAPGLAPEPVRVFNFIGVAVTLDQVIVYASVVATVVLGSAILRYTDVGLKVRALVDSPAMTALSGTSPSAVSIGVWAVSTFFAGLAGVLAAPIIGLDPNNFTLLIAAAFAAVIAAKFRSLPIAVTVGLAMGVVTSLIQRYLPSSSNWTTEVVDAVPFMFIAVFLIYNLLRRNMDGDADRVGGALDRAITPQGANRLAGSAESALDRGSLGLIGKFGGPALLMILAAFLPILVQGFWVGLMAQAFAYGIIFLSFTLVTGEGGMIWLCQITFAGVGALTASQLATNHGWPILAAIVVGGLVALPMGLIIGFLTIRLGDLYVALVTLTFGLLMENLVFTQGIFTNLGLGVNVARPSFAVTDHAFAYVCLIAFAIVALFVLNLRRSTTGLALNAVRWSPPGARTLGISVVQMKIIVAGLGALVAGIGGGFLVVAQTSAQPANFATFLGVVWLAALVTVGVRSNTAALIGGLSFTMLPALALAYLPSWTGQLPAILFGAGAIAVARFPDGSLAQGGEAFRARLLRVANRRAPGPESGTPLAGPGELALNGPMAARSAPVVEEVPS